MNPYSELLESIKGEADFLDLTNTNFTSLTPLIDYSDLKQELETYLNNRNYAPTPKGLLKARQAIAEYYKAKNVKLDPENIVITASTSESYSLIFSSLLQSKDKILLPNPSYPLFSYLASYARTEPLYYDLIEEEGKWKIDLLSLKKNISKAEALILISPNNPTGMMISKEQIKSILDLIREKDILLILDEVFSDYVYEGNDHGELLKNIVEGNKVIILNGISKALASPDLKLAWIALHNCELSLIDRLETANDTYLNCSYLSQSLLPLLFNKGKAKREQWLEILNTNRNQLQNISSTLVNIIIPQGGIHCVVNFPALAWENEKIALKLLEEYHLAVHPGYFYDFPPDSKKVIFSLLQDPEKFKIGLSRLIDFSIQYS